MEYKEALEYINSVKWYGSKPGLGRIEELLEKLGSPQKKLKFIHIAGTNGKGSCAAMTASVMKTAGYKTGLFISPYIYRFSERMQVNGREIENEELTEIVEKIKPIADAMADHPTVFELMTAAAMVYFAQKQCDIVVLEAGLGGRFDATNIIERPECSVIMNIGLDHTEILGATVEKIALEKAGIIKEGCPTVSYQQLPEVRAVIEGVCREKNSPLTEADFSGIESEFDTLEGQVFSYKGDSYALSLLGAHQRKNAAVVIELAAVLRKKGWDIPQDALEHGMYAAGWPARFEVCCEEPYFVVDGGHNPQCAETVAENLRNYFPACRRVILMGVLKDKDYRGLADVIAPEADEFICVSPKSERALPARKLAEYLEGFGKPVRVCESIEEGVGAAIDAAAGDGMVCAVGSLYMAGDIRACFNLF